MSGPAARSRSEVAIRQALLERILRLAGPEAILVGGQALAFWASHYGVALPLSAVTKDADFLGQRADVARIARGLGGQAHYVHEEALTALVGQVTKDLPGGDYINIDVLFRLHGDITTNAVRARAAVIELAGVTFKVLHPMDVLQGRLENLYSLKDKQDEHGVAQLALAITMARAFMTEEATRGHGDGHSDGAGGKGSRRRPVVLLHVARVSAMARSDAGRKVARRFKVHVADAIAAQALAGLPAFTAKELPLLAPLMSKAGQREQGL